ncbi:MAG TPA: RecQ family zinc-binding domain-containing protein [Longimicrobiales bacterium]|nr:RecQ family zinc-binding domain-containing protein [Longimicrobiales bacterium]
MKTPPGTPAPVHATTRCRRRFLLDYFGEKLTVVPVQGATTACYRAARNVLAGRSG